MPDTLLATEAERVRRAYDRRRGGDRYEWSQPGQLFMMQALERELLAALHRHDCLPLRERRILEMGCGTGHFMREFMKWGADPGRMVGIDLLETRLAEARRRMPVDCRLEARDAAATGYADQSFDLILQATMLTSILSMEVRHRVAQEMLRLLAPGGRIIWYDLRVDNPRNPDVRGIGAAELRELFPGANLDLRSVTLAPPLARGLAAHAWWACAVLARIPFLRTHYLGVIWRPGGRHD